MMAALPGQIKKIGTKAQDTREGVSCAFVFLLRL